MAKKKESGAAQTKAAPYTDKYELMVEPTTIITKAPDRERFDLKKLSMEQADRLYSKKGQQVLKLKNEVKDAEPPKE